MGPLEKLRAVKKISEEDWESSGGKKAFKTLKEVLSNTPVLHNPDFLFGDGCVTVQGFQDLLWRFFGIFITFVFGFITPFRLYDGFARITYI